jgi:hypothetical protein
VLLSRRNSNDDENTGENCDRFPQIANEQVDDSRAQQKYEHGLFQGAEDDGEKSQPVARREDIGAVLPKPFPGFCVSQSGVRTGLRLCDRICHVTLGWSELEALPGQ